MSLDGFWEAVDAGLERLKTAQSVDDVFAVFPGSAENGNTGQGFFPGGGGDDLPQDALYQAGWQMVKYRAPYYWVMRATNGELLTYVEGDMYRGDSMPEASDAS